MSLFLVYFLFSLTLLISIDESAVVIDKSHIVKFAPKWMFKNSEGNGYPMNPQIFYEFITSSSSGYPISIPSAAGECQLGVDNNNNEYCEINNFNYISTGLVPTLYAVNYCNSGRIYIHYFIAYGYQHSCSTCFGGGKHQGGFEYITVVLNEAANDVYGVYFKQHTGWYFGIKNELEFDDDTHVKVYVGKYSHGTYDDSQPNEIKATMLYFEDPRKGDKTWIPNDNELYDITDIDKYSFNNGVEPHKWNGLLMEWMKVNLENEFPESAHYNKQEYGKQFYKKISKLSDKISGVCFIDPCKGQDIIGDEGCKKCSCLDGTKYEDYTKDKVYRCKQGCGNGWTASGSNKCVKNSNKLKTKKRENYGRDNQPFEI